jgi:NADPH:quinone reductase-like Zn-dependent oxidoreductase
MLSSVIPSVNAKWEVKEVPTPQAGTNQVLIKIHASGICYTDVHITKGGLGVKFPYTIGHEPAGEIVAIALGELKSGKEVRTAKQVEETEKPGTRGGRAAVTSSSISAATIAKVLLGIDFPKSKNDLKEYVRDHISKAQVGDIEEVFGLLDELPSREYSNMADVEREIGRIK